MDETTHEVRLEHLIFQWVLALVAGTFLSFIPVKTTEVGPKYFWYHGVGGWVLVWACYFAFGRSHLSGQVTTTLLVASTVSTLYFFVLRLQKHAWNLALVSAATLLLYYALGQDLLDVSGTSGALFVFNGLMSASILGLTMGAMLLGHWYLIQPTLSIDELKRLTIWLIVFLTIRFLYATWGIGTKLVPLDEAALYRYLFATTPGLFSVMRWLWGVAAPLGLSIMVWKTVKIRSTQSATGILYVVVLCAFSGEILSLYLAAYHGLPY